MSEVRHTPAPWFCDGYNVRQPGGRYIAYTGPNHTPAHEYPPACAAEDKANARIISSVLDLLEVALAYEKWEADMILCDRAWRRGAASLPTLTQELWGRLLEIQKMRNAAIAKARGGVA